jgi:ABC-type glycerol-3-phosphate transport system substrate-binding protein
MQHQAILWRTTLACLSATLTLAACGGSNHTADPNVIPVATTGEFTNFVATRAADEASEPIEVEAVLPPTSETEEPRDVT